MVLVKVAAVVLLWMVMYYFTPSFGNVWTDGLVPIMLGAAAYILVFWIPYPRRAQSPNTQES